MESSNKKQNFSLATNDYNFSLLADPNKIKDVTKTIVVKNSKDNNTGSDSEKSNLIDINEPESEKSEIQFINKKDSRKSSTTSNKSSVSSRKSRHESIKQDINSIYVENNKSETKENKKNKENPMENNGKNANGLYIQEQDNYNELDDTAKRIRKMEKFAQLTFLKMECKCVLSKQFTMNSDYWEMCAEIKYHRDKINKANGVNLAKQGLSWAAWAIEYFNGQYDPLHLNLSGWSEHVELTKDNYTEVFEELYEKYKGSGRKIEPEVKLLFAIGFSAMTFHATKSAAKIPGLEEIIGNNPELAAKLESTISKNMMASQKQKTQEELIKEAKFKSFQHMQSVKKEQEAKQDKPNQTTNIGNNIELNSIKMKMPPNISNILNKQITPIDESDTTPDISSIKNTKVDATETVNINSDTSSITTESSSVRRIKSTKRQKVSV